MSLQQWVSNGWLRPHKSSAQEVSDMLAIVERDLADAAGEISADWRFGVAYNATLKLCTILLHASGHRPEKNLAHYRTLAPLPLILGSNRQADADYLDACRTKRNTVEYDRAGAATHEEAAELAEFAREQKTGCSGLATQKPSIAPFLAPTWQRVKIRKRRDQIISNASFPGSAGNLCAGLS